MDLMIRIRMGRPGLAALCLAMIGTVALLALA
jgi:hypothetical protein